MNASPAVSQSLLLPSSILFGVDLLLLLMWTFTITSSDAFLAGFDVLYYLEPERAQRLLCDLEGAGRNRC